MHKVAHRPDPEHVKEVDCADGWLNTNTMQIEKTAKHGIIGTRVPVINNQTKRVYWNENK